MNKELVKKYLTEHPSVALDVARECNSWNGRFPEFDTYELSELLDLMRYDCERLYQFTLDVIYASKCGEFEDHDITSDAIRYDDFSRIEIRSEHELEEEVVDYIDDIIEELEENYPCDNKRIYVSDEGLKELLDELDLEELEADLYDVAEQKYKSSEINADVLIEIAEDVFCVDGEDLNKLREYLCAKEELYVEE